MTDSPARLGQRLEQEADRTDAFFRQLPPSAWRVKIYTAGSGWTARSVLAHFVSAERALGRLLNDILGGGSGAPRGFDINQFNESEVAVLADEPPDSLLSSFREARTTTVRLTQSMQQADLARVGRHPWFGEIPIDEMVKLVYRHNQIHQRDIRKVLSSGVPLPADVGGTPADAHDAA